ncbi:hypothetical protein PR202_gb12026 [Eleusine coracana subsp. coracana]|uniref:Uncharacterized protein n=1 Tax=Eleusine coracana subsp. coracana TaxID=191504 RepID=A0AAV5EPI6_ELECO|nr:hypothetical protein PR202_gb12026 [Eleusine coracana subsp. coracana]
MGATCNNLRCHPGGPFLVVFVGFNFNHSKMFTCVYSSQAGTWNHLNSFDRTVPVPPSVLVGNALYLSFPNTNYVEVLKYNTDTHGIDRVIELETLLPADDRCLTSTDMMLGFTEGTNVIFLRRNNTLFTIDLMSNLATKVYEAREIYNAVPYMAFYTPGAARRRHRVGAMSRRSGTEGPNSAYVGSIHGDPKAATFSDRHEATGSGTRRQRWGLGGGRWERSIHG